MRLVAMDTKHLIHLLESEAAVGVTKSLEEADPYIERLTTYGKMLHADDQLRLGVFIENRLTGLGIPGLGRLPEWRHLASVLQETSKRRRP